MNELFAEFQKLRGYLKELECQSYQIILMTHLDGSGCIGCTTGELLHFYRYTALQSTTVEWSNPEEGVAIIKEVLATLAVSPQAVVWY